LFKLNKTKQILNILKEEIKNLEKKPLKGVFSKIYSNYLNLNDYITHQSNIL